MTDATKANRSPAAQKSAAKGNAAAKHPHRPADEETNVKAGETAVRDAAELKKQPRRAATARGRGAGTKAAAAPAARAKARKAPKDPAIGRDATHPAASAKHAAAAPAAPDTWTGTASTWQQAGLHAGSALAENQLAAARTSTALGIKLMALAMANTKAQLGAARTLISAADVQRKWTRDAFSMATGQANAWAALTARMVDATSRTWTLFETMTSTARKRAD